MEDSILNLFGTSTIGYWGLQTLAMLLTAILLPGFRISSIFSAFLMVAAIAFVNATVWDAALFFNIPQNFSIHALTLLFSNAALFWVLVKLMPGVELETIIATIAAPLLFTVCSLLIDRYEEQIDWGAVVSYAFDALSSLKQFLLKENPGI